MQSEVADWSVEDQAAGYSLPACFFYDENVFRRERTNIFFKSWHLVSHINELREPGSYVTHDIFEQSVLVVAGRDGELRAFHNVCQHRGNRLVASRRGKTPTFTCGYHAWSYTLDGCLRGAPNTHGVAGFEKRDHGLKPVRVETFASFVFVNLDLQAKPIAQMAAGAEAQIRRYIPDLDRLTLLEEVDVPVAANWKVIQENSIEGYHFDYSGPAHKELLELIDFSGYALEAHGDWWTYVGPPKRDATEAYGLPLRGATWQTDWFFNFGLWPNATLYAFPYADMVGTFIMNPTGPESSMLRFGYYGVAGRELPKVTAACIRWMNQDLGPEDINLNQSNQKGLRSLGFDRGRYVIGDGIANRSEHLVRHFHGLCYQAVREAPYPMDHRAERVDLAAAFRWFARMDMHESVANHLSLAVSPDGSRFLINPRGRHFARICAGDLLLLDATDRTALDRLEAPDPTAWHLHARLHERLPAARCVMHLHSKYATALACLKDSTLYPIDMNTMRFFGRVALDSDFSGMALSDDEGERVAALLEGGRSVLLMANHGALVIGPSVAQAFDEFYHFERAAETLLTCYATGKALRVVSDEIAALTERQWRGYGQLALDHFENIKGILDAEEPSYKH